MRIDDNPTSSTTTTTSTTSLHMFEQLSKALTEVSQNFGKYNWYYPIETSRDTDEEEWGIDMQYGEERTG